MYCDQLFFKGKYIPHIRLAKLKMRLMTNKAIKTKNKILAIPAEAAAIPPKPKTAAIRATTKNPIAHPNIISPL